MASAFGHALAALTFTKAGWKDAVPRRLWAWSVASSVLPDIDVVGFKLGIPYAHPLGHRGLTHSIAFAFVWSLAVVAIAGRSIGSRARLGILVLVVTLSHGALDAMTNGGLGVGFFIPFNDKRYFFPFRPIQVSPIGVGRFFARAAAILGSECVWIGIPCAALLAATMLLRAGRQR